MQERADKDLFVVHSKGDALEARLAEFVAQRVGALGFTVWRYEDWHWERAQRTGRKRWNPTGRIDELDLARYLAGDPLPFGKHVERELVDEEALNRLLRESRVVLLVEPRGAASEGVAIERRVLAQSGSEALRVRWAWANHNAFFESMPRALDLECDARDLAALEADAATHIAPVLAAVLVRYLQVDFGSAGGHRLLARAAGLEAALDKLVTGSASYVPEPEGPSAARLYGVSGERFAAWWPGVRAGIEKAGPNGAPLLRLVECVDAHWQAEIERGEPDYQAFAASVQVHRVRAALVTRSLVEAVERRDASGVEHWIAQGEDPNGSTQRGDPLVHCAVQARALEVLKLLLGAGADPDARAKDGGTPLIAAAGAAGFTRVLLERGANPNLAASDAHVWSGLTPLIRAAEVGDRRSVEALLEARADPTQRDGHGRTALDYARDVGRDLRVTAILEGAESGTPPG